MTKGLVRHNIILDGRSISLTFFDTSLRPPLEMTKRAYGLCFVNGDLVLVQSAVEPGWYLPGGGIEDDESPPEALVREIREETQGTIDDAEWIGSQLIEEAGAPDEYHLFFWCRLTMPEPFTPTAEIVDRRVVAPARFVATLAWGDDPKAAVLLERALAVETSRGI